MQTRLTKWAFVMACGALGLSGCRTSNYCCPPRPSAPLVAGYTSFPGEPARFAGGESPQLITQSPLQPTPYPIERQRYSPPALVPGPSNWRPAIDGGARLIGPPSSPEQTRDSVRLQPPESVPPELAKPGAPAEQPATAVLPSGIAQFNKVKDDVASGLKPHLDGVDWLKESSYRTILHLRQPGEDDAADRGLVQLRGMKFLSLEVSPATLSRAVVDEFNRLVGDTTNYPLFVYDRDGSLAGGLWYLYARTIDRATDAEARTRANRLGLKLDQNGDHRLMWLAIQEYLQKNPVIQGL